MRLGGVAVGRVQTAAKHSTLQGYPLALETEREQVEALSDALAAHGAPARAAIDAADELGEKDTVDLFTGISRGVDRYPRFVEAHLG